MHTMQKLMQNLRTDAPTALAAMPWKAVSITITAGTGLPRANVLEYRLSGGHKLMVRPSGTEPKIKVYLSAVGESEAEADAVNQTLSQAAARLMQQQ